MKKGVIIAATGSGVGKTFFTCGLISALKKLHKNVGAFKCGPDYIDPMFHKKVLGTDSHNLDSFFCGEKTLREIYDRYANEINVIEGVMGYYDGIGGNTSAASTCDIARKLNIPTILVVNGKGSSNSIAAVIKGFLEYEENTIKYVVLNNISPMIYPMLKKLIEEKLSVKVLGYIKKYDDLTLESRHLGLITPDEIAGLSDKFDRLGEGLIKTIDFATLFEDLEVYFEEEKKEVNEIERKFEGLNIAFAYDSAFSFTYRENIDILEALGAKINYFSPVHDTEIPKDTHAMILSGGYPELYAEELSENKSMLKSIKNALESGMPVIAECGGFMYLHKRLKLLDGRNYEFVGAIDSEAFQTKRLVRFGYINLTANKKSMLFRESEEIRAHEFHYFDSTNSGSDIKATKASLSSSWDLGFTSDTMYIGYPHLYFYSNLEIPKRFLEAAKNYRDRL